MYTGKLVFLVSPYLEFFSMWYSLEPETVILCKENLEMGEDTYSTLQTNTPTCMYVARG